MLMAQPSRIDRYLGCIVGGAAGDALGYPIEFDSERKISRHFGEGGIATLTEAAYYGHEAAARFSDDTQMTLFTAAGLLSRAASGSLPDEEADTRAIWDAYGEWYTTQRYHRRTPRPERRLWITSLDALNVLRAPGTTCLGAIGDGVPGAPEEPQNHSKGCGGIMRVAPVGLYYAARRKDCDDYRDIAMRVGARAAALTHGHTFGWLPAAVHARIVASVLDVPVVEDAHARREALSDLILAETDAACEAYAHHTHAPMLQERVRRAVELAAAAPVGGVDYARDLDAIHELGEGWVGEEALYIAVYAVLAHADDLKRALRCAVNHRGDSDSTGSVTGNILGAYLGMKEVRSAMELEILEQVDLLEEIALELYHAEDPNAVTSRGTPWGTLYQ